MKKISALVLCFTLLFSGCAFLRQEESGGVNIVTTIFPQYDFARNIAGSGDGITMLLDPGAESHSYDPSPSDIVKVRNCDIFIMTGGESDQWAREILDSMDGSDITVISLMDCVDTVEEEIVEGMDAPRGEREEGEAEYDEHVWTSPVNAIAIVERIAGAMEEKYPENAEAYRENAGAYIRELLALDGRFRDIVAGGKRRTVIFGDRFPMRYFADEYGLQYYAAFPGCSSESEPGVRTVAFLIDKMRDEDIPAVFYIEFSNMRTADALAEDTGAEELLFHSCHTVSREDFRSGVGYLELMERNAENLEKALG